MKKLFLASVLSVALFAGCDKKDPTAPVYPPPVNMGTGTVLFFSASNQKDFENRFNEHMSLHPEYRTVSQHQMENDSSKWMVIVQEIPHVQPPANPGQTFAPAVPAPTTAPVDPNR